jgi:antitoxin component YwqK of YwqJK toxin-antitoxin module
MARIFSMRRYFLLLQVALACLSSSLFAISLPACPKGTERFDKDEDGMKVSYCAKPVEICPGAENIETVTYEKDGGSHCAIAEGPVLYTNQDKSQVLMEYHLGVLDGEINSYSPTGKKMLEEDYKNGQKVGTRTEFFPLTGKRKLAENYLGGLRDGVAREWHPSGKLRIKQTFKKGKREGKFEEWFENGKLKTQASFVNGIWVGPYNEWYSNGKKFSEAHYRLGKLDGYLVRYHRNGRKASQRLFRIGKINGEFLEWDDEGRKLKDTSRRPASLDNCTAQSGAQKLSTTNGCITLDLDGNGHADYVMKDPSRPDRCKIYMMRGNMVLQEMMLLEPTLELYTARFQEGQFGEPITPRDGLVAWGKGSNTRVYLYDFDRKIFFKSEHASDSY